MTGDSRSGPEQAVDILQAAAIEAIKAVRSFLDIAETLVREPETAAVVGKAFAEAAASALRRQPDDGNPDDEADEEEATTGRLRRIDLSD